MTHEYKVEGMTCKACKAKVEQALKSDPNIEEVTVNLEEGEATISMKKHLDIQALNELIPEAYTIKEKEKTITKTPASSFESPTEKSKLEQLKPLLIILFYIAAASNLMHYKNWEMQTVMLDFMGLFFIVFSFFKMLDLQGFPSSFRMYDPLAKRVPVYAKVYPFIETVLGLMFLFRFQINFALIATIIVLGITTVGVTKTLLDKKAIRCACLGTALKLPMTEATFIENAIMLVMSIVLLVQALI